MDLEKKTKILAELPPKLAPLWAKRSHLNALKRLEQNFQDNPPRMIRIIDPEPAA